MGAPRRPHALVGAAAPDSCQGKSSAPGGRILQRWQLPDIASAASAIGIA